MKERSLGAGVLVLVTLAIWAWTALGVGAALAVGAAVMYGVGATAGADAHDSYMGTMDWDEIHEYRSDIDAARTQLVVGHVNWHPLPRKETS